MSGQIGQHNIAAIMAGAQSGFGKRGVILDVEATSNRSHIFGWGTGTPTKAADDCFVYIRTDGTDEDTVIYVWDEGDDDFTAVVTTG